MAKNINSAYRIKEIINSARNKAENINTHEVWADIFGIKEADQNRKNFSISRCLADLHDEVEHVRSEMQRLGYSVNLYNSSLNKCNSVFAVHAIMSSWKSLKQQITPEVAIALGFCSEILPNEEDLLDEESLEQLRKLAKDLRETLEKSTLPQYTISIIQKHLVKIEEALTTYKIVGAKALDEVLQAAYGEVIANEAIFEQAKGSTELSKLSLMWQKTKSVLDGIATSNDRLGAIQGMAEKGQKVIEFLENFNV